MKRIGFINWMFFFFLFLAFFHPHLKGILNSMENNYVDEKILDESKDTLHFSESALKLYRFPFNPKAGVVADKIPYEALTHIVLPGFVNRSGGNEMDSIVYQEFLRLKDDKVFKRRLEDKHLLINFKFEDFKNYSDHLNMVYVQLDTLGKYYSGCKLGIVFEVDFPLDAGPAMDTLVNSLSALSDFIPNALKNLQENRDILPYLCVNYTHDAPVGNSLLASLIEKVDSILSPKGYIIKTFDSEQNDLATFDRLKIIFESTPLLKEDSNLIVCVPTFPVIARDPVFSGTSILNYINIESLNDSTIVLINNTIDNTIFDDYSIKPAELKFEYFNYEALPVDSNKILLKRVIDSTVATIQVDSILLDFNDPATPGKQNDTTEFKIEEEKVEFYRTDQDSLVSDRTISSKKIEITTIDTSVGAGGSVFYRIKKQEIFDTTITETYGSNIIFFETAKTLQSKLDFFAGNNLNIGFWNEIEQPKVDATTVESSTTKNPVIELFNYAKSFFKKLLKLKVEPGKIHSPDRASTCSGWDCYWETIVADHRRGLPNPPDYFLVLFAPFFALRILMPFFTLSLFRSTLSRLRPMIKYLQINLFGNKVSPIWMLIAESLFWIGIALLFVLSIARSGEPESVYTTRVFSFLFIIFLVLGRPVIKFLIKLFRLFGKPVGKSLLKKIWKQVIPHLGTLVNTNFFDEDEKKNAINHVLKDNFKPPVTKSQNDLNGSPSDYLVGKNTTTPPDGPYSLILLNPPDKNSDEPNEDQENIDAKRLEYQWKRLNGFFALKTPTDNKDYEKDIMAYKGFERKVNGIDDDMKNSIIGEVAKKAAEAALNNTANGPKAVVNEAKNAALEVSPSDDADGKKKILVKKVALAAASAAAKAAVEGASQDDVEARAKEAAESQLYAQYEHTDIPRVKIKSGFFVLQLIVSILIIFIGCLLNHRAFEDTFLMNKVILVFFLQTAFIVYFFFDYFSFYVLKLFSRYA